MLRQMLRHRLYLTCNGYLVEWPEITCIHSATYITYISFLSPHAQQVSVWLSLLLHAIIDSLLNRVAILICNCVMCICVPKMQEGLLIFLIILCLFVMIAIARRHQRVCCGRTSIFTMRMQFRTSSAESWDCDFNKVRTLFHDKYKLATIVGKRVVKLFRFRLLLCVTAWVLSLYLKSILFSFSFVVVIKCWLLLQQALLSQYSNWASIVFFDCTQLNCYCLLMCCHCIS